LRAKKYFALNQQNQKEIQLLKTWFAVIFHSVGCSSTKQTRYNLNSLVYGAVILSYYVATYDHATMGQQELKSWQQALKT